MKTLVLFSGISILLIIIQLLYYVKSKYDDSSNAWSIFTGTTIANIFSSLIAILTLGKDSTLNLGGVFLCCVVGAFLLTINVVILVLGIKNNKDKHAKDFAYLLALVIVLITSGILLILPPMNKLKRDDTLANNIVNYLTKKYGDQDFKIDNINYYRTYSGFNSKISGYTIGVKWNKYDNITQTTLYSLDPYDMDSYQEHLLEYYYQGIINDNISKEYNYEYDFSFDEGMIPNDLGHIPTIKELYELRAVHSLTVTIHGTDHFEYADDDNGCMAFLVDLTQELMRYFNYNDIEYEIYIYHKPHSEYSVKVEGKNITITNLGNKNVYSTILDNTKEQELD